MNIIWDIPYCKFKGSQRFLKSEIWIYVISMLYFKAERGLCNY